ncbi:sugar/nucleoside kinase (ribokinase family) [Salirhabdus euzebyi]|uniref:Sugar/nucleoside kinase (Ribokinase family) n=1 Tax=Salirhabdus euzebyi TaxID=394506 RepID=A0A841Q9V6_9BACI|nr:carbohydrate kinase family protein [Salirhabdus euzebyi]MBB6455074.1 sugar/nucleoside kinase (ribokinase family) [Salirhabdus euzebyi]
MITTIGDLVVDLIVSHKGNHFGTDSESSIATYAGGQANHVAAWIAKCESNSTLVGRVGNDLYGDFLLKEAKQLGITTAVERDPVLETGKIIILVDESTSERSMYTDRGANIHLSPDQVEASEETIQQSSCLYISGYALFQENTYQAMVKAKEIAKAHHVPVALDPSSTYFLEKFKKRIITFAEDVDFLFPNYEEGVFLTGEQDPDAIMVALKKMSANPILKLGDKGCLLPNGEYITATKVKAVDTTGAGDSFIGAFLAKYEKTKDIFASATFANQIAATAVQKYGGRPSLSS